MKIVLNVIRFIAIVLLMIGIVCTIMLGIGTNTILKEQYVLNKLSETNFYNKIDEEIKSNFENYIFQSGLDEDVIKDVYPSEKIENDIKKIISNIYNGTDEKIETESIKNTLNERIDALNIKNSKNESSIEKFVNTIADEYEESILHTKYEKQINTYITKINRYCKLGLTLSIVLILSALLTCILTSLKELSKIINCIGISFVSAGTFVIVGLQFLISNIKIEYIKLLNDAFSYTIINVCKEIIQTILTCGVALNIVGGIGIIAYAIIKPKNKEVEKEKRGE